VFPCQPFSIAGSRIGFEDTRGTLFFEIARIADHIKPKIIFLENVKGLLNHDRGRTFAKILITLDELGYDVEWQCLNSKDFGVPQNRERVFIIGHLRGERTRQVFPIYGTTGATTRENSSTCIDANYWKGIDNHGQRTHIMVSPVLTPDRLEKRQNGRRCKNPDEPMFTLTAQDRHGVLIQYNYGNHQSSRVVDPSGISPCLNSGSANSGDITPKIIQHYCGYHQQDRVLDPRGISSCLPTGTGGDLMPKFVHDNKIRKLTPVECERLQGFPDGWTEGISDSARYRCLGNAVTVNVIEAIAEKLLRTV
jgi:DNA (cytosine-5)-methyltransferase 1